MLCKSLYKINSWRMFYLCIGRVIMGVRHLWVCVSYLLSICIGELILKYILESNMDLLCCILLGVTILTDRWGYLLGKKDYHCLITGLFQLWGSITRLSGRVRAFLLLEKKMFLKLCILSINNPEIEIFDRLFIIFIYLFIDYEEIWFS